jgi:dolichol kinase
MKRVMEIGFPRLHLRDDLHLARKAWHLFMGLLIVFVYLFSGMSRSQGVLTLGFFLAIDLFMETARLSNSSFNEKVLKIWGPLMRESEATRMSAIPHYLLASIIAIGVFPKPVAVMSILYLAVGDPMASLFGILYGNKGPRFAQGRKSLIGTLAGVVSCALITLIFMQTLPIPASTVAGLVAVGGLAGGLAELLPVEVDDNFTIPVVSGFVLSLAFLVFGI